MDHDRQPTRGEPSRHRRTPDLVLEAHEDHPRVAVGCRHRVPWLVLAWAALLAIGLLLHLASEPLERDDLIWVQWAAAHRTGLTAGAARHLSYLGRPWLLYPAALLTGLLALPRRGRRALAPLLAEAGAKLLQTVLKTIVHRPRPPVLHLEHVTGTSFPSGHATQSAALLLSVALLVGPGSARALACCAAIAVALAVAASRVELGVHYPTDVAAGFLLGSAWAVLVTACASARPPLTAALGRRPDDRRA